MQIASFIHRIILSMACVALPYFSTLCHNFIFFFFRERLLNIKCVFGFLYNFNLKYFSFREEFSQIWSKIYTGLHVKCPFVLPYLIKKTWFFWTKFRKIHKLQISWKSVQWGPSCSMLTEGRTDVTKLKVNVLDFTKAPDKICGKY